MKQRTAEGEGRERVLEDLLKPEELDDGEVHGGVEAQATLVRAQRAAELDTETAVHTRVALVIHPGHLQNFA